MSALRSGLALAAAALALASCGLFDSSSNKTKLQGTRISVLALDKALTPDPALAKVAVVLPPPYANPSWPEPGGYANHAMYHLALPEKFKEIWRHGIGFGASRYTRIVTQPVVANGRVFAMDGQDIVSAYDAGNGDELWRFDPKPENALDTSFAGGVAAAGGRVFIATGYGQVVAVDARSGIEVWRQPLPAPSHDAPTVAEGRVFAITVENQLVVLSAEDGRQLWTHIGLPETANLLGSSSPAVDAGIAVIPYTSGEVFALRVENGRPLWSDALASARPVGALGSLADIRGGPVIDRDRVFALSHSGLMVSLDLRTGDRVWEQEISGTHAPWVAGDYVYVLSNDTDLICMQRRDGHVRWVRGLPRYQDEEAKSGSIRWVGPVLASDRLIVISSLGEALAISPYTGRPLGRQEFPAGVFVDPVVANETLYVLTDDADLIALR